MNAGVVAARGRSGVRQPRVNRRGGIQHLALLSLLAAIIVAVPWLFDLTKAFRIDPYLGEFSYPSTSATICSDG